MQHVLRFVVNNVDIRTLCEWKLTFTDTHGLPVFFMPTHHEYSHVISACIHSFMVTLHA